MRVFVAGGTGAIGRPLVERLRAAPHDVTVMTRSPDRAAALRGQGVDAAVADAFDPDQVRDAVRAARPEVVIHQLTSLPDRFNPRRYGEALRPTNRLRRETIPSFVRAAREAGARRLIAQSIAFMARPEGGWIKDETAPLWHDAPPPIDEVVAALHVLESAVTGAAGAEGVVLRYGFFYGPGTSLRPGGGQADEIRRRRFPVVGDGAGRFSFIHVDDAAAATVLALDHGAPGIYHVTDDEPVAVRDWVPALASIMGAKRPRRVPLWLARLVAGAPAETMVRQRGASNAKARAELDFRPRYPSYREGFAAVFGASLPASASASAAGSGSAGRAEGSAGASATTSRGA
jgi:nucleoside-diphosphate-sugar epimerase